jgi:hypothetical protein
MRPTLFLCPKRAPPFRKIQKLAPRIALDQSVRRFSQAILSLFRSDKNAAPVSITACFPPFRALSRPIRALTRVFSRALNEFTDYFVG